jgi:succinyl-CoA synthetase beta subunit
MTKNLLDEWKEEVEITPKEALDPETAMSDIRQQLNSWTVDKQVEFLRHVVNGGKAGGVRRNSKEDRMAHAVSRCVRMMRKIEFYKTQIQGLKDRIEEDS